jgi:hypothetical protein
MKLIMWHIKLTFAKLYINYLDMCTYTLLFFFFVKHLAEKTQINVNDESVENMASNCANNYYCTYCEKYVSSNKKLIEDHNNSKPHQRFLKLQKNTHLLKRFCIGNWLVIFINYIFYSFKILISNILIYFHNRVGRERSLYGVQSVWNFSSNLFWKYYDACDWAQTCSRATNSAIRVTIPKYM